MGREKEEENKRRRRRRRGKKGGMEERGTVEAGRKGKRKGQRGGKGRTDLASPKLNSSLSSISVSAFH